MPGRVIEYDIARALAIIGMALDHTLAFMGCHAPLEIARSELVYDSNLQAILRVISNLSPTAFIFLAGGSLLFASYNRSTIGWSRAEVLVRFFCRGVILIAIELYIVNLAWSWNTEYCFGALSAIGVLTILISPFLNVTKGWLLTAAISVSIAMQILFEAVPTWTDSGVLEKFFFFGDVNSEAVKILYPVFPWIPIALLGVLSVKWFPDRDKYKPSTFLIWGAIAMGTFFATRLFGVLDCLRPSHENEIVNLIISSKYPPSLAFSLFSVGIVSTSMWLLALLGNRGYLELSFFRCLAKVGEVPLFLFIFHVWLYRYLAEAARLVGLSDDVESGLVVFSVGLGVLIPCGLAYRKVKLQLKPFLSLEGVRQKLGRRK